MTPAKPAGRYGKMAMGLHWGMALIIILALPGPLGIEVGTEDQLRAERAVTHASLGFTILLLMLFRLGWRIRHPVFRPGGLAAWESALTFWLHHLLYLAIIVQGCLGLTMAVVHSGHIRLYWMFDLYPIGAGLPWSYRDILPFHSANMRVLMFLIGLHICPVLVHFLRQPGSYVVRMLPKWMSRI